MSLLQELRRRKVFRVGLAYLVAAWLVAQVAELVADSFGAPGWFMQVLLVLLALGLPVALFLSWAFDLTPDGLVRDRDVTPADSARASRLLTALTIALLASALAYFVWESRWSGEEVAPGAVSEKAMPEVAAGEPEIGDSIAVLPFENFSGDPADEYFADGLADTLLHKLAQIDQLTVIARNSSFQFKGQNLDIREIGRILGVDTVLEGSVQRAGGQVRIIAQLIRVADGAHLWSQSFDDTMENIFALQDRVASDIAQQLQLDLSAEQRRKMMRDGTNNPEAYELLIRAINERADYDDMADVDDADWPPVILIRQALALDPNYVQAWARLSAEYNFLAFATENPEKYPRFVAEAERAALRAVELAPDQADGHDALGWVAHRKREKLLAQRHFRRALELEPNRIGALSGLALQLGSSDAEEALELLTRVLELQPTSVITHRQKHFALARLGRYEEAIAELEAGLEKNPDAGLLVNDLSDLLIRRKGRPDLAAESNSRFLRLSPGSYEGLAAMLEAWTWATGSKEAGDWAAVLLSLHGGSDNARLLDVERLVAEGRFGEALEALDQIVETDRNRWRVVSRRAIACLGLGRVECTKQQTASWKAVIEQERIRGLAIPERLISPMVLEAMVAEDAQAGDAFRAVGERIGEMPYYSTKFFLRAGIAARMGDTGLALQILDESLSVADPGVFGLDIFGYEVAHSPLLEPLRGLPAFEDWRQRYELQRAGLLERMRTMEGEGGILSAESIGRMTSP